MKPEKIDVPHLRYHSKRAEGAMRMAAMSETGRATNGMGMAFLGNLESHYERPAIRGIAAVYNTPSDGYGRQHPIALLAGCFTRSLESGAEIKLQFEHDGKHIFGSTKDGLRFIDTKDFLAFEYPLTKSVGHLILTSMVAGGTRADVSVSASFETSTVQEFRGVEIKVGIECDLKEISITENGAIKGCYAEVVDLDDALSLEDSIPFLRTYASANEVRSRIREMRHNLAGISEAAIER